MPSRGTSSIISPSQTTRLHKCSTYLIEREGQTAKIAVPDGTRVVMMMRGHAPLLAPIDEPGCYEVDGDDISPEGNAFPVAIAVVDLGHVKAWLGMDAAAVGRVMDGIDEAIARRGHVS